MPWEWQDRWPNWQLQLLCHVFVEVCVSSLIQQLPWRICECLSPLSHRGQQHWPEAASVIWKTHAHWLQGEVFKSHWCYKGSTRLLRSLSCSLEGTMVCQYKKDHLIHTGRTCYLNTCPGCSGVHHPRESSFHLSCDVDNATCIMNGTNTIAQPSGAFINVSSRTFLVRYHALSCHCMSHMPGKNR